MRTFHRDGWFHDVEYDRYMEKAQANKDVVFAETCPDGYHPMTLLKWKIGTRVVSEKLNDLIQSLNTEIESMPVTEVENTQEFTGLSVRRGRPPKKV